ncbi:MAG: hypothetical protein AAF620_01240 [Bacteroidota bacterium]
MSRPNFFKDCTTLDEARKTYYKLAKQHHPNKGGDHETFVEIGNQFKAFRPGTKKYENEFNDWNAALFSDILNQLMQITDITIEVCGSWLWIGGNTKPNAAKIKSIDVGEFYKRGFSRSKSMWYFSPKGYRKRSKNELTIDEIRGLYDHTVINSNPKKTIREAT